MTADEATGIQGSSDATRDNLFRSDWRILRDTVLKSVATSPDAFLADADQLAKEPPEYWRDRLESATWVVLQRRKEILGIAAAKPPGEMDDYALREKAQFIESVWIDPSIRANGFGERLVTYLIEHQRKAAGIQAFYLWVVDSNEIAIHLYDRMHFKRTYRPSDLPEIQFLRAFDSDMIDDEELKQNVRARKRDRKALRISYRLLAAEQSWTHLPWLERLTGWQAAGSISRYLKALVRESRRGRSAR
jgi:ribosomal protein S18 acetylase RimI-like enzyme